MNGDPEDPIEIGSRLAVDIDNDKRANGYLVRLAIHETIDGILDKVDPINLEALRIHVEETSEGIEYGIPRHYRVEARGKARLKNLKEKIDE